MIVKENLPVAAFRYVIADVEPEPAEPSREYPTDLTVPCAYCGKLTPPALQATRPWYWPSRGYVTNCESCAGIGGEDPADFVCNEPPCGPAIGAVLTRVGEPSAEWIPNERRLWSYIWNKVDRFLKWVAGI